jgi:O-antigen/teichoic acid export membrane protein
VPQPPVSSSQTDTQHAAKRYRAAGLSAAANLVSKALLALITILAISQTVGYLGTERFAAWMLLLSLVTLLMFLDLGLGNALSNRVSALAAALDDQGKEDLSSAISHGLFIVLLVACAMGGLLALFAWHAPWQRITQISQSATLTELREAAVMLALCFALQVVANAVQRVYAGLQRAYIAHAAVAIGAAISIALLLYAAAQQARIAYLLLACIAPPALACLVLVYHLRSEGLTQGALQSFTLKQEWKTLLKPGALFMLLQLGAITATSADALIVSATLGAQALAVYAVGQRLFQLVAQPFAILNTPLWPAYADAHARGDKPFIARTLKWSMLASLGGAVLLVALVILLREPLISIWTQGHIQLPLMLALAMGAWCVLEITGGAFAMFLNGCGVIAPQVVIVSLFVVIAVSTKIAAALNFGLIAVPIAGALAYLAITVGLYSTVYRKEVFAKFKNAN